MILKNIGFERKIGIVLINESEGIRLQAKIKDFISKREKTDYANIPWR